MENKNNPIELFALSYYDTAPQDKVATLLAAEAGVTYATVHKAIRGLYTDIPAKLTSFLVKHSDKKVAEWQQEYHRWIQDQIATLIDDIDKGRTPVGEVFFADPYKLAEEYGDFLTWRKHISDSQMEFCRIMFLHQGIINKYENRLMKNIPESLYSRVFGIVAGLTNDSRGLIYAKELAKLPITSSGKAA